MKKNNIKGQLIILGFGLLIALISYNIKKQEKDTCSTIAKGVIRKVKKYNGRVIYTYSFYVNEDLIKGSQSYFESPFLNGDPKYGDTVEIKYACGNYQNSEIIPDNKNQ